MVNRSLKILSLLCCVCLLFAGCTTKAEQERLEKEAAENKTLSECTELIRSANPQVQTIVDQDPRTVFSYGWETIRLDEERLLSGYAFDTENSLKEDGYSIYGWECRIEGDKIHAERATDAAAYESLGIKLYEAPPQIKAEAGYYRDEAELIGDPDLLLGAMGTFIDVYGVQLFIYTESSADQTEGLAQKRYAELFTDKDGAVDGRHILIDITAAADGRISASCAAGDTAKELIGPSAEAIAADYFEGLYATAETFTDVACDAIYSAVIRLYLFEEAASFDASDIKVPEKLVLNDNVHTSSAAKTPNLSFAADGSFTGTIDLGQEMYAIGGTYRAVKDSFGNTALVCNAGGDGNAFAGQEFHFTELGNTNIWLYTGNTMGTIWFKSLFK